MHCAAGGWDDLLVEYKNAESLSKTRFAYAVAAVIFVLPHLKGELRWCQRVQDGMAIGHVPRHTVPEGEGFCNLIGAHLSSEGHGRLGFGHILQSRTGMRPGEMLQWKGEMLQ